MKKLILICVAVMVFVGVAAAGENAVSIEELKKILHNPALEYATGVCEENGSIFFFARGEKTWEVVPPDGSENPYLTVKVGEHEFRIRSDGTIENLREGYLERIERECKEMLFNEIVRDYRKHGRESYLPCLWGTLKARGKGNE